MASLRFLRMESRRKVGTSMSSSTLMLEEGFWLRRTAAREGAGVRWVSAAGSLFSAVSWMLFSYIFSFYVSLSNRFGAYGYIGTIMVAMMWLFYCFYFLLIGGYINRLLEQRRVRLERQDAYEAAMEKQGKKHRKQG